MMIRNPSLKLNNLPDLPHPDDLSPGVLDALSSDGTDPATINTAAKIIAARDTSNPFYRLLADGPTPEVRVKILDRCPALGPNQRKEKEKEHGNNWLWEKEKSSPEWNPVNSMGWDCAFVGALYNKMRVRKDLVDELLDMFLRYADPLDRALGKATEALQVAEAAAAFQQQSLNEAERGLDSALDFVNNGHAQLHQIAVDAVSSITGEIAQLATRERQLRDDIRSLRDRAISLPDKIDEEVGKSDACKLSPSCRAHTEFRKVTNPVKQDLIENLTSLQNQLDDLRTNVKSAAQDRLVLATQRITNLDAKLQQTRVDLERGALHAAFDLARAGLQVKMKTLFETRKALAEARRANALVMSRLAVWRDDPAALEAMSETPEIPSSSNQAQDGDGAAAQLPLNENFSIVGSFRTERSAFRHLLDLNRIEKGLDLDVFLPFSKSRYWVVTSASFSTLEEAKKRAKYARQTNLQNDAFVLGMPNAIQ
jgi:hypothetical protein